MRRAQDHAKRLALGFRHADSKADFIDHNYGISFIVHANGQYRGMRVDLEINGPTTWIDTSLNQLTCYYGPEDTATIDLLNEDCDELDEIGRCIAHGLSIDAEE